MFRSSNQLGKLILMMNYYSFLSSLKKKKSGVYILRPTLEYLAS